MNPIKTILLFLTLSCLIEARSQYFPDSLVATGVQTLPSVSQGYLFFLRYYRDSLTYDSTNSTGDFYTVQKRIVEGNGSGDTASFMLRVSNKRTYLTGTVRYGGKDIGLSNLMIYDYNHNVGDTFIVRLSSDTGLDFHFKLDSLQLAMYKDGIKRITYYYTLRQGTRTFGRPVFSAEGLGSSLGLVYLRIDEAPLVEDQLISDCTPSKLIYGNNDCNIFGKPEYHIAPYCEEDSVKAGMARAISADVRTVKDLSQTKVYPNPASDQISLLIPSESRILCTDQTGRICMDTVLREAGEHTINTSLLRPGVYIMTVRSGEKVMHTKLSIVR